MKINAGLLIVLIVFIIGWIQKNKNSITDYGAIADGKMNNAVSIQRAIDQVAKNGEARSSKEIAYIPLNSITSIPENETNYPEFSMFGELPSWGFYVRHAEGIKMKNIKLSYVEDDFRPALVFDDVKGVALEEVTIPKAIELPVALFNNTTSIALKNMQLPVSEEKGVMKTNYK
jgi:hypothetical protein